MATANNFYSQFIKDTSTDAARPSTDARLGAVTGAYAPMTTPGAQPPPPITTPGGGGVLLPNTAGAPAATGVAPISAPANPYPNGLNSLPPYVTPSGKNFNLKDAAGSLASLANNYFQKFGWSQTWLSDLLRSISTGDYSQLETMLAPETEQANVATQQGIQKVNDTMSGGSAAQAKSDLLKQNVASHATAATGLINSFIQALSEEGGNVATRAGGIMSGPIQIREFLKQISAGSGKK